MLNRHWTKWAISSYLFFACVFLLYIGHLSKESAFWDGAEEYILSVCLGGSLVIVALILIFEFILGKFNFSF